jgi:hypothetical protein
MSTTSDFCPISSLSDDDFLDAFANDSEALGGLWFRKPAFGQEVFEAQALAFENTTTGVVGHA